MVRKILIENKKRGAIELVFEPLAETLSVEPGSIILIESEAISEQFDDEFPIDIYEQEIIIYERRLCNIKVYLDAKLVYKTPGSRYFPKK